jgi:hypothetical protein
VGISLKKSDFHLSNSIFSIFCYEISATALAGRFCVACGTHDTKIQVIKCQFPLCISILCAMTNMTWQREPAFSVGIIKCNYEYFMLKQCLENIGEGLLHACISS